MAIDARIIYQVHTYDLIFNHKDAFTNNFSVRVLDNYQAVAVFKNYMRILSSSILSDLGIASQSNVLANADLFKSLMQPVDFAYRGTLNTMPGAMSKVNAMLADLSNYSLPFTSIEPMQFNAEYMGHYQGWKPRESLAMDVCVAIASLFMVFWGGACS